MVITRKEHENILTEALATVKFTTAVLFFLLGLSVGGSIGISYTMKYYDIGVQKLEKIEGKISKDKLTIYRLKH